MAIKTKHHSKLA